MQSQYLPTPGASPIFDVTHVDEPPVEAPAAAPVDTIWLINPANLADVHELTPAVAATMPTRSTTTPRDTLQAGALLVSRGLPVAVANTILDASGSVLVFEAETTAEQYEYAPADAEYLRLTVPTMDDPALELLRCTALVIECTSHDQGWATDAPELNGSYNRCYSWAEFQVSAPDGTLLLPRREACRNLRASGSYRHHLQYVTDPAVLRLLLTPGNQVSLHLRAMYGGWSNQASYGRLALVYTVGLNENSM
ncbi:hypothetical protein SPRG_09876 [Saprolegnia parasitica CBS 223.65]|uniref:Uncharacterized protein n=1 Tax=Saprolegnia parasitica (strain CBS 223.65) TaxID=695850 RepID=A0A067C547_SAPPC|nr:hypothetical protein SPRG_09876 [Saprolegnia parasitica CBS 223.65]KDO24240.1 hypothetical protein SPRG_09876 [Saprolegnia parasitica CBS 223.65]|eukprot:XP_012205016.1 hypothetical protein SPRG_09876 [Saprolegnia parasitica CBS 223.65]